MQKQHPSGRVMGNRRTRFIKSRPHLRPEPCVMNLRSPFPEIHGEEHPGNSEGIRRLIRVARSIFSRARNQYTWIATQVLTRFFPYASARIGIHVLLRQENKTTSILHAIASYWHADDLRATGSCSASPEEFLITLKALLNVLAGDRSNLVLQGLQLNLAPYSRELFSVLPGVLHRTLLNWARELFGSRKRLCKCVGLRVLHPVGCGSRWDSWATADRWAGGGRRVVHGLSTGSCAAARPESGDAGLSTDPRAELKSEWTTPLVRRSC